ncbi:MAG: endonuclease/exonuclease/phosphatase family protein [Parasphingopyxis sp.]|uniref:endonuclease/exonuclease/phosphatase family protein n=1 Tax=Parasphingopyxis sp. TaxID=1920299 RepID=UPI003F9ED393
MDWRFWLFWVIAILAGLVCVVTLLSAIESNRWWIRTWDFPRFAIFTVGALIFLAMIFLETPGRIVLLPLLGIALAFQAWNIFPYTPFAAKEAEQAQLTGDERAQHCVTLLSINVYMHNRDYERTLALIDEIRPDILLLMETDQQWLEAMQPALSRYAHRFLAPLSNEYGKILATNLAVESGHIVNLTDPETPSAHAVMRTEGGRRFRLAALHPRPPLPGDDTEARDAELIIAARMVRNSQLPAVVVGDFNDVGWSHTSRVARRIGGYVDPRIGRGFYATFPASWPAFRWPLDHVFFTEDFALVEMRTERPVGSDHLPVYAEICLSPELGEALNEAPEASSDDFEQMEETIDTYRESEIWSEESED